MEFQSANLNPYFCVVEFVEEVSEEGEVAMGVVSNTWLVRKNNKLYCKWPQYIKTEKERLKTITNHIPLIDEKCSLSLVHQKYKSENYYRAVDKLKILENQSSVSQTSDEEHSKRRNCVKTTRRPSFDYESFEEDDLVPRVPTIFTDDLKKTCNNELLNRRANQAIKDYNNLSDPSTPTSSIECNNNLPSTISTTICSNCKLIEGILKTELKTQLEMITQLQRDVSTIIRFLQNSNPDVNVVNNEVLNELPVQSVNQLVNLNKDLQNEDFMSKMCGALQVIGGRDTVDTTRRIMQKLMKNVVALEYNWLGRNNKQPLKTLQNIIKLIVAEEKREATLTGGGPPSKIKKDETDDILLSIINKKTLVGLSNNSDDDAEESPIMFSDNLPNDVEMYLLDDIENVPPTHTHNTNSIETFGELNNLSFASNLPSTSRNEENRAEVPKTPKSNSRRRPTTSVKPLTSSDIAKKYDMLMDKRLMLVEGQLKDMQKEHELLIKKRNLEIELLELEVHLKKKNIQ
ncbi:hypothetical protein FQR65_LT15978 [Abscondita terminalis]|nr:hypothetical protein FQR65_LT15978 [Abscondita terminalis]